MIDRERLRAEMQKQGISQAVLASAAGVSPASIQQILNGTVRNPRSVRSLAAVLGVAADWLEGLSDDPKREYLDDVERGDITPVAFQYFAIEKPSDEKDEVQSTVIVFSKNWIERVAGSSKYEDIVVFKINSPDMAPTFSHGDEVILVSKEFNNHPDGIWFFKIEDESFVRRVRRLDNGRVSIAADNPAFATFEAQEATLTFLGQVVWHGRQLGA